MNSLSTYSSDLLSALWRASCQGAIAIALTACLCRTFARRIPASVRCLLWRLTYAKLLVALVIAGGVALPLLRSLPAPAPTSIVPQRVPVPSTPLPSADNEAAPNPVSDAATADTSPANVNASSTGFRPAWQLCLVAVYGAGLLVCLVRVLRSGLRTQRLQRSASAIDDADSLALARDLAIRMRLRRVPRLAQSVDVSSPIYVAGAVLLPASANYPLETLRLILAHEFAHARRRDLIYEWLGAMAQTIFWFHPLVRLARREERLARESAADALALSVTSASPAALGNLLLALAQQPCQMRSLAGALGAIEGSSLLHRRLVALKEISPMSKSSVFRPHRSFLLLLPVAVASLLPWHLTPSIAKSPAGRQTPAEPVRSSDSHHFIPYGNQSLVGQVLDDSGKPVSGVEIYANLTDPVSMRGSDSVRTDKDGRYEFKNIAAGHYFVSVGFLLGKPAPQANSRPYVAAHADIQLTPEDKGQTVNFTASRGATLSGRVRDRATGAPIADACVVGWAAKDNDGTPELEDKNYTDASGRYFVRLPAGSGDVFAAAVEVKGKFLSLHDRRTKKYTLSLGQSATEDIFVTLPAQANSQVATH